ncbi:cytochrome b5 [Ascobolus immersus RN42]|uniref:Cytochrome b5 n=1 Tax=Ascobolus immersus RN42 TaxID=1160509 RepID=A0A3N4HZ04_ASCIM|nr:cytochrome b5 [Ascobolus immersus RN42]
MSEEKQFTYAQVKEHDQKKDVYMVVHDVVYDLTEFVDEHPGGEEVMLDVAGDDATEAFEDVGHSDEARDILKKYKVGILKREAGDPKPKVAPPRPSNAAAGAGTDVGVFAYAFFFIAAVVAYGAYQYLEKQKQAAAGAQ